MRRADLFASRADSGSIWVLLALWFAWGLRRRVFLTSVGRMMVDTNKIAVVTVHGTGDTAEGPEGEKWFQNGSEFAGRLQERLSQNGVESEVFPHLWTGANSASAREKGSMALAKKVKRLAKTHAGVYVVGHSHGGNVANDAACMLGWADKKKRKPKISSITTVGTPFFRTIVKRSEKVGAWAFLLMVIVSMIVLALSLLTLQGANEAQNEAEANLEAALAAEQVADLKMIEAEELGAEGAVEALEEAFEHPEDVAPALEAGGAESDGLVAGLAIVGTVGGFVIVFIMPLAFRGIARIRRAGRKQKESPSLYTIWHPNDEAIAFLQRVESLPIEVFPRWSLLRGSRTGAILWGVRAAIWTPVVGIVLAILGEVTKNDAGEHIHPMFAQAGNVGFVMFLVGLAGAPILFGAVYLAYRAIVAVVLEIGLRGQLNGMVGNALRGIALGRDGDNRIGEVSEKSHYYGCDAKVLDGDIAQRMLVASQDATRRLFDKYRSSLFSVGADENNAIGELTQDAMTWDSLIHTTYFDQPEMAVMIADNITAAVGGGGEPVEVMAQAAG